ncbi:murein hydrolase activator EnvC family protein [Aestuariivirga sp.]|uniref:murein hydrolase activator EnvC family protein n=1 Tax=Aestuariivirga sp. TaxID=2650926 RepID=UPI0039E657C9
MLHCRPPAFAAAALALLFASAALAQDADVTGDLSKVEEQLDQSRANQQKLAADVAAAQAAQEEISSKLIAISAKVQAAEASITGSEADLLKLHKEQVVIMARLAEKQDVLSELLAGLQRLEQNPPPALVVDPNDVLSALRGAMMFGTIVPELRGEADRLVADLQRLEDLKTSIQTRKTAITQEIAALESDSRDLQDLILAKKQLVASGNAQLADEQKRAADLASRAKSMQQLMASLDAARKKAQAEEAARLAAADAAKKAREAALQQPRLAFADAHGKLAFPAQGAILRRFGDDDGLGGTLHGLAIATRTGAEVTAPADGHVEFAGPFRSYGQVLILNPGGGYHILLAGLDNVTAVTGEFLRAGEPVGHMGSGPSSVTLLGDVMQDKRPVLYIEFRNNSDAIDSGPWWIGGMKEARG